MNNIRILECGTTCWRVELAHRVAFLIDSAYFAAAEAAIRKAQHSIVLVGWTFDARTKLNPKASRAADGSGSIADLLKDVSATRPELEIRLLIWKAAALISAPQAFFPQRAPNYFDGSRVRLHLDDTVPFGASHHQKFLVIDNKVAFCGGGDFSTDRWDSPGHFDCEPGRRKPSGKAYAPRHDVMMLVDGAAAAALGELAAERWRRATGETLDEAEAVGPNDPWPDHVLPNVRDQAIGITRTEPKWLSRIGTAESEALHLRAIRAARCSIYVENQYFTSARIGDALCERLSKPDGPEIVLVLARRSPSYFDHALMDTARGALILRLAAADLFGRFRAYCPQTSGGRAVIVHSKVMIVDDRFVRIGSANLNNRSAGFDTECDLAFEVDAEDEGASTRGAIRSLRATLLSHFLGSTAEEFQRIMDLSGSAIAAIETLDTSSKRRLVWLKPSNPSLLGQVITAYCLGDPRGTFDAWRPWRRH